MFFANYLVYFDEALTEYLNDLNLRYADIKAQGYDWVYAESRVRYRGSAKFEDLLSVHVRIGKIGNSSVTAEFQIFNQETQELIVTGELVFVVVDDSIRKPAMVPEFFRKAVALAQR